MLPTPSTSHICFDNVYEPAEDSYLLLDTLSSPTESAWLQHRFQNFQRDPSDFRQSASPIIVEVGTGSGVVLAFVTAHAEHIFGRRDLIALGTDVNAIACRGSVRTVADASRSNASTSASFSDVLNADLIGPLRDGLIDVLIFNPPYVPTEAVTSMTSHVLYNDSTESTTNAFERDSHLLSLSYAGGINGMEVTNRLLEELSKLLSPSRGVAYILLCAQNKPLDVRDRMKLIDGFDAELVGSSGKQAGWEKLQILRIWKQQGQ